MTTGAYRAVEYIKQNVLTAAEPADIYVYAPANSAELANAIYMQLEYGTRIVRPGGIFIVCASRRPCVVTEVPFTWSAGQSGKLIS